MLSYQIIVHSDLFMCLVLIVTMPKQRNHGIRSQWTNENMQQALTAVGNGVSVNLASKQFLVPRRTLRDYLKNHKTAKSSMGRKPILNEEQEEDLCRRIIRLAEVGYPLTGKVLRKCVFNFCHANNIAHPFNAAREMAGRFWLSGFLNRHPQIRNRKAQSMNPARAQKLNKFIVNDHFAKLKEILNNIDIMDKPQCIYNMDEKGCRLALHHQQTVLAKKGAKRVHLVANEHGQNVTIVSCGSALGCAIPPLVLFKGKRLKPEWQDSLPPGSLALMTAKGSMTIETFKKWLYHFAKYKTAGPCLLIFDGARCHLDYSIVSVADELGITLYCLPSNTTHELQPMDKAVFRAFEHYWDEEVLKYWSRYRDRSLTKQRFGAIFSIVWDKCMTPDNIKSGFAACGIYPFNADILPVEAFAPSTVTEQEVGTATEIVTENRIKTPPPGPSRTCRKRRIIQLDESSDSEASDIQMSAGSSDEAVGGNDKNEDCEANENAISTSFSNMLTTPDLANIKSNRSKRTPALNSRAQVVTKQLFTTSDLTGKTSTPKAPKSRKILKQTTPVNIGKGKKKLESWYCKACKENRVADMRLCILCNCYLHEECLGLTNEDTIPNFICPYCS